MTFLKLTRLTLYIVLLLENVLRSNGKTYAVIKKVIEAWFSEKLPSAYVRRFAEDIKGANMNSLFNPHLDLIKKLSKNKYNHVEYRNNMFTLCYIDSSGKTVLKADTPLMYTCALSNYERSKGQDRGEIKYFIFDEFATRSSYLSNEFVKFSNVHSSFVRARSGVITYMLANTVNKYCVYFDEMGLREVEQMVQGEIYLYKYNDDKLTVAVEYCDTPESKKDVQYYYAFENEALKMIKSGQWEEGMYPHLGDMFSVSEDTMVFKFFVQFGNNLLTGEIHQERNEAFLFFHRFGSSQYKIKSTDLVYTNQPTTNIMWLHSFSDTPILAKEQSNILKVLMLINKCLRMNKIFFSTNSVGEVLRNFVMNPYEWVVKK